MTSFSLAHLTVLNLPPPEMVRVAARTGYHYIGLRMIAVTDTTPGYPLMHEPSMMRDTKAALAAPSGCRLVRAPSISGASCVTCRRAYRLRWRCR